MGAYIALHHGNEAVFMCSVLLIAIDLIFIAMFLPESLGAGYEDEKAIEGGEQGPESGVRIVLGRRGLKKRSAPGYVDDSAFQVGMISLCC